jgi:hypothetical protein
MAALEAWVEKGTTPPASRIPRLADRHDRIPSPSSLPLVAGPHHTSLREDQVPKPFLSRGQLAELVEVTAAFDHLIALLNLQQDTLCPSVLGRILRGHRGTSQLLRFTDLLRGVGSSGHLCGVFTGKQLCHASTLPTNWPVVKWSGHHRNLL